MFGKLLILFLIYRDQFISQMKELNKEIRLFLFILYVLYIYLLQHI